MSVAGSKIMTVGFQFQESTITFNGTDLGSLIAGKADNDHTHTVSDITGYVDEEPTSVSCLTHLGVQVDDNMSVGDIVYLSTWGTPPSVTNVSGIYLGVCTAVGIMIEDKKYCRFATDGFVTVKGTGEVGTDLTINEIVIGKVIAKISDSEVMVLMK